jgi:hypothetical protein
MKPQTGKDEIMNIETRTHNGIFFTSRTNQLGDELVVTEMEGGFMVCARVRNNPNHPEGQFSLFTKMKFQSKEAAVRSAMSDDYFGFNMTFSDEEGERLHNKLHALAMKMRKAGYDV